MQAQLEDKIGVVNDKTQTEGTLSHSYEEVLKLIGFGYVQWMVLFAAGLLLMMVINETMGMSIITIASQCELETTNMQKAFLSAASFVGILCSSYFWGYLSDTVGRRPVLIYTTLFGNILSLASIFISSYWFLVALRFFVGFFIAGASSTTYAYLGEFFTPRHRALVINYASMFVGISMIYIPAVAWLVLSTINKDFPLHPWRLLIVFYVLPGVVAIVMLFLLPESPKLLLSLNKNEEAFAAVNWIAQKNTGKQLREFKVQELKEEVFDHEKTLLLASKSASATLKRMWQETRPLLKKPHFTNFFISCTVMCGLFFSSSGMGLWFPEIQNRLGSAQAQSNLTVCEIIDASIDIDNNNQNEFSKNCVDEISTKSYIDSITYGSALTVGYILMGFVINPLGRKNAIVGGLTIAAACALALIWIKNELAIVVCFCLYLVLPGLCVSVLSGAVVDLVPTHLRGKAVCICLMLGRSGSVFGSNIIGVLLETYCSATFGLFSGFVLLCAGLTLLLPM